MCDAEASLFASCLESPICQSLFGITLEEFSQSLDSRLTIYSRYYGTTMYSKMNSHLTFLACNQTSFNNSSDAATVVMVSLEPCYYGRKFDVYTLSCDPIPGFSDNLSVTNDPLSVLLGIVLIIAFFILFVMMLSMLIEVRKLRKRVSRTSSTVQQQL